MKRRVDFDDWQQVRASIGAKQTRILAREDRSADSASDQEQTGACAPARPEGEQASARLAVRPAEGKPLHSHKPRSDDEWAAIADGVRALLAERERSGRWTWVGRRRVVIE